MMKIDEQKFLLFACFYTMAVASVCISLRGLLLPTFKNAFGFDNSMAGIFISISMAFSVLFSYMGSIYIGKIGQRRLIQLGCLLSLAACLLIFKSDSFISITLGFGLIASGMSLIVLGLNTILPLVTFAGGAILMNLLHFFYGFGSTLTQKGFALFMGANGDWRHMFLFAGALFVSTILIFEFKTPNATFEYRKERWRLREIGDKRLLGYITAAISLYIASEFLAGSWVYNFLTEGYSLPLEKATLYTTVFFLTFTVGRLLGGFLMEKLDVFKWLAVLCTMGFLAMTWSLVSGESAFIVLSISGVFFSTVYPSAISKVNALFGGDGKHVIAFISAVSSFFALMMNFAFGFVNKAIGVRLTFYAIPLFLLASAVMFIMSLRREKARADGD